MSLPPYSDDFLVLWKTYPRGGKRYAFKKYAKLTKEEKQLLTEYIHQLEWPSKKEEIQYLPHMVTIINQQRWEGWRDDLDKQSNLEEKRRLAREEALKKQKEEEKERYTIKEKSLEEMAQTIKESYKGDLSYENLKSAIKITRKYNANIPAINKIKKKRAQAIAMVWGKELYIQAYNELFGEQSTKETTDKEKERRDLLEQQKKMLTE